MKNRTILVVESEPKLRNDLKQISETWANYKHDVIVVKDDEHALAMFKNQDIYLLIEALEKALGVDVALERMVGDTRLEEVRVSSSDTIKKAICYIHRNFKDSPTLRDVAEHVHLNPSYFSVLFREHTNLTFSEYMMRKKIQEAKKLLLKTSLSVDEVAEEVGYQSSKYFIKMFKNYEGVTPGKYRRQINLEGSKST